MPERLPSYLLYSIEGDSTLMFLVIYHMYTIYTIYTKSGRDTINPSPYQRAEFTTLPTQNAYAYGP